MLSGTTSKAAIKKGGASVHPCLAAADGRSPLNKTEMSFFCVSGAQDDNGKFNFRTTKNTFLAKGVGTEAEKLNGNQALHNLQVADAVAFELQQSRAARDWSKELGKRNTVQSLGKLCPDRNRCARTG